LRLERNFPAAKFISSRVAERAPVCYFLPLNFWNRMNKKENEQPVAGAPENLEMDEPLSPEQIEELKSDAAKFKDNWVRLAADFENFKKRAARERSEAAQYANAALLQKLLPVLDNFEMALAAAKNAEAAHGGIASLQSGVTMIQQQLKNALAETGLEEIESTGQPFDPSLHEAVSEQETADVPEHHVAQQLRKGYKLRDRLLRPATVVVAKKPAPGLKMKD
jgi:molecular chaperone GrpE